MVNRVHRLFQKASRQISRLADSGRSTCRRIFAGSSRKKPAAPDRVNSNKPVAVPEVAAGPAPQKQNTAAPAASVAEPVRKQKKPAWSLAEFPVDPLPGKSRFQDFDIDLRLMRSIAAEKFYYCTPIQAKALPAALAGSDLVARAQTGTGKSAVFLVALFSRLLKDPGKVPEAGHPRALIIAPTRELVIQIAKDGAALSEFSPLTVAAVYGGADYHRQEELLRSRRCDVIAATPGRLLDFIRRQVLSLDRCSILVIDEADRMLDMGFIPDVRRIISQMPAKDVRQTMLFSATITDDVRRLAEQWCRQPVSVEAGEDTVDVDRIDQRVYLTTEEEKYTLLYNLIASSDDARILVFANMKNEAATLARRLEANGIACQLLSGDVPQQKRISRLESFRSGKTPVLIATDVAGRGIHIDDIKYVVNYTLPYEPEDYVHRIGRTGRAGADGVAVSYACETGSFYLPAIEEFIGRKLACIVPEEELLVAPPQPVAQKKTGDKTRRRPSRRNSPRSRSGAGKSRSYSS